MKAKVLVLSPNPAALLPTLVAEGPTVFTGPPAEWPEADYIVSYGYRHIVREPQLTQYRGRIINIHLGALPWNRGAHPNFWSWFDDTPKGVTIHHIDAGIDTGDTLIQHIAHLSPDASLRLSHGRLQSAVPIMFKLVWTSMRLKDRFQAGVKQRGAGSFHREADLKPWRARLPLGWDTPVATVMRLGEEARRAQAS